MENPKSVTIELEKAKREQEYEYEVKGAVVTVKERKGGAVVTAWDMAALPEEIRQRLMAQGGSTILQQRKSGKNGLEAIAIMDAHYRNWLTGAFVMERKNARIVPNWVFPVLCFKLPTVAPINILASLEDKKENADDESWATFIESLKPYKLKMEKANTSPVELVSLD